MPHDTAERRWAAAARLAEGVTDEAVTKRRRKVVVQFAFLFVVALVGGLSYAIFLRVIDGTVHPEMSEEASEVELLRFTIAAVLMVIGLGGSIAGFVWARRTGRFITKWSAVISPLSPTETKNVRRQIAGKETADEEHLTTIVAIARQNRNSTLAVAALVGPLTLVYVAVLLTSTSIIVFAIYVALFALLVIAGLSSAGAYRRAGSFIAKHSPESFE